MADAPTATLTVKMRNGDESRWEFELSPDAPLDTQQLKEAMVSAFIHETADPEVFKLTVGGTASAPAFQLEEGSATFFQNRRRTK